jgi:uncharacterized protein
MTILQTLLSDLPMGWRITDVYIGANWVLSKIRDKAGVERAGVAAAPHHIASDEHFQIGHYSLDERAEIVTQWLGSTEPTTAAVGLATFNALNQPDEHLLTHTDAADWLSEQSLGRNIAIFGRFPFIDAEIRPYAKQVWVFELQPQSGELDSRAIETVLPHADCVAITGSSIVNHTLDLILPHTNPHSTVVVLGPSTPLSTKLFDLGISALFGVCVTHMQPAIDSVVKGVGFQQMNGLQRVSLFKED